MSHSSEMGAYSTGSIRASGGISASGENVAAGEAANVIEASRPPAVESAVQPLPRKSKPQNENDSAGGRLPPLWDAADWAGEAPAWLISAILHMLLLIILGVAFIAEPDLSGFVLRLDPRDSGDDLQHGDLDVSMDLQEPLVEDVSALDPQLVESTQLNDSMVQAVETPVSPLGRTLETNLPPIRMALSGREAGMKQALLAAYGGTAATEESVKNALGWLTRNQIDKTGLWSLVGPYANGASNENPDAATALALLAFQGAGYTPQSDPNDAFTKTVRRGWIAFLRRQNENGSFFNQGAAHGRFYTQAIATIAVCELYGMTQNSEYREPAQKAIDYCISMQTPEGGWRYYEHNGSDLSVTGWMVMALQSARMAGLEVDSVAFSRVDTFLESVSRDIGAQYAYLPSDGPRRSMTAEGLLCRQYLGWSRTDPNLVRGVSLLIENLPSTDDREAYYWYYATQVCHHMEGDPWRQWNSQMRTVLPSLQVRSGRERGSWSPRGDQSVAMSGGGRLFITCLSTYMLEVYYRHLPLYQLELVQNAN